MVGLEFNELGGVNVKLVSQMDGSIITRSDTDEVYR